VGLSDVLSVGMGVLKRNTCG